MIVSTGSTTPATFSEVNGAIAILEGTPTIALDIETMLKAHGAPDVVVLHSLAGAARLLEGDRPAAAIIDTRFAGVSGVVVATTLASMGVPILFLNADPAFQPVGNLAGVTVISKPHGERELVEALVSLLKLG